MCQKVTFMYQFLEFCNFPHSDLFCAVEVAFKPDVALLITEYGFFDEGIWLADNNNIHSSDYVPASLK